MWDKISSKLVENTEESINETPPKFEAGTLQQQLRHTNRHAILATPCCRGLILAPKIETVF
jgi:hypothetical protein